MNLQWIGVLCISLRFAECQVQNCCQGNNILEDKKCEVGSLNDVLGCDRRFVVPADEVTVNETYGFISFDTALIESDDFCRTVLNTTTVYIVCYNPEEVSYLTVILGFISAAFLFLTIGIYLALPKLLDIQGICMVHSLLGLACAFIILGSNWFIDQSISIFCTSFAYLLYFCFLYAFFWLNTYCFNLWRTTIEPKMFENVKSWKTIYYAYSCGFPSLLLCIVLFSQYTDIYILTHPRMAEDTICWFGNLEATFFYLYLPISILLVMNLVFFFWTIYVLWRDIHRYDGKKIKILRYRLSLCIKMFFVMGLSWIFEVLSAVFGERNPLWKFTDVLNSLQGVFLFLVLVVSRKKVYRLIAEKPYGKWLPATWKSIDDEEEDEYPESIEDYKLDQVNESS